MEASVFPIQKDTHANVKLAITAEYVKKVCNIHSYVDYNVACNYYSDIKYVTNIPPSPIQITAVQILVVMDVVNILVVDTDVFAMLLILEVIVRLI